MEEFTEADFKEIRAILAKDQGQQWAEIAFKAHK
jgi:hypothetical protein